MRKILFVLFAALAFVACDKDGAIINNEDQTRVEKELPMLINPPRVYNSPQEVNCNKNGATFTVKTQLPAIHYRTLVSLDNQCNTMDCEFENTEMPKMPYEIDRKLYKLTQIDNCTFEITIKPFSVNRDILFDFGSSLSPSGDGTRVYCRVSN